MDLSILIVTYNSAPLIGGLLERLRAQLERDPSVRGEVIVVDNGSRDGTAMRVARDHPWVRLACPRRNLGFAAGVNAAASLARGRYLLLLNPDALPSDGSLAAGVRLMDANPAVALGGGRLLSPGGRPQPSARMFPTLADEFFTLSGLASRFPRSRWFARMDRGWADPLQPAAVDWIPGAFVFVRHAAWRLAGGFDERFFMYYEEVDLCRRLAAMGHAVAYWPVLTAVHEGGASARTVEGAQVSRGGGQLEAWRMRSALLYYRKHHGWTGAWGWRAIESGWTGLRRLRQWMRGRHERLAELDAHARQLAGAWHDTRAGRRSPSAPW